MQRAHGGLARPEAPPVTRKVGLRIIAFLGRRSGDVLHDHRHALAAAGAGRRPRHTAAGGTHGAPPRWVGEAHARGAERMTDGDRAAMHVGLVAVERGSVRSQARYCAPKASLISTRPMSLDRDAGQPCGGADRRRRADAHDLRRHRHRRARHHPGQRLQPWARTSRRAHQHHRRAIDDGRGCCRRSARHQRRA